uniref:N,O-diacetylmuramidase n=1 Tax=Aspergillus inflatus TaxID=69776 RepID=A0A7S6G7I7_9EURO|nr:GH25 muramidase [Aspergillus inflatus]
MKFSAIALLASASAVAAAPLEARANTVQGFDISSFQPNVDFAAAYKAGARFVMMKATQNTNYVDKTFNAHYEGATKAGLIRGGYHFAIPNGPSGAAQAEYFLAHGGGWSDDGKTLPGMIDLEYNPYGQTCYDLSAAKMVDWIKDFSNTYHAKTKRYPMIYTTANWWKECTGDSKEFSQTNPLVLARYSSSAGTVPGGWPAYSFWQNADKYKFGGDSDIWNGSEDNLKKFAKGA